MAAGAQDGKEEHGPRQRRRDSAGEEDEEVRHKGAAREHRGRVAAHSEERSAGEIHHAGVAELHVEAETGDDDDEYAGDQEKREVVLAQEEREPRDEGDGESPGSHTRSLARSPMRPVGRMAMMAITTPKAKTSL